MQKNLKAELIAKTGLTAIAFLLIGTMAIAQSATTSPATQPNAASTSKQSTQKKWLPSNFRVVPGQAATATGNSSASTTSSHANAQAAQESGKSGVNPLYESGHSARAEAATSASGHPKPAGQLRGVPLKGGITPKK